MKAFFLVLSSVDEHAAAIDDDDVPGEMGVKVLKWKLRPLIYWAMTLVSLLNPLVLISCILCELVKLNFFGTWCFSNSHKARKVMSGVLKYTRADLATLTYHPVRPLDVISKEVWRCEYCAWPIGIIAGLSVLKFLWKDDPGSELCRLESLWSRWQNLTQTKTSTPFQKRWW